MVRLSETQKQKQNKTKQETVPKASKQKVIEEDDEQEHNLGPVW